MLTGRRAFDGEGVTDTLARILEREPDWTAIPTNTPASIRALLQRCLRKDPQTIGDIKQVSEVTEYPLSARTPPHHSLIFKGRPAACHDWRAPFAKSSTPPHDPLFVDKQIGVYRELGVATEPCPSYPFPEPGRLVQNPSRLPPDFRPILASRAAAELGVRTI